LNAGEGMGEGDREDQGELPTLSRVGWVPRSLEETRKGDRKDGGRGNLLWRELTKEAGGCEKKDSALTRTFHNLWREGGHSRHLEGFLA